MEKFVKGRLDLQALGRLELGLHSSHQRCVFGRLPSNEVVLEHASISRQHAQLSLNDSRDLLITDLGSGRTPHHPSTHTIGRCELIALSSIDV